MAKWGWGTRKYRHVKTGGSYTIVSDSALEVTTDEARKVVVYENDKGQVFVQDHDRFFDGRFVEADEE